MSTETEAPLMCKKCGKPVDSDVLGPRCRDCDSADTIEWNQYYAQHSIQIPASPGYYGVDVDVLVQDVRDRVRMEVSDSHHDPGRVGRGGVMTAYLTPTDARLGPHGEAG